jgi:hypothetical protein
MAGTDTDDNTEDGALFVAFKRWLEHMVRYGREEAGPAPRMPSWLRESPMRREIWLDQFTTRAQAEHAAHTTPVRTWRHRLWDRG